jgi:hypothetical protein
MKSFFAPLLETADNFMAPISSKEASTTPSIASGSKYSRTVPAKIFDRTTSHMTFPNQASPPWDRGRPARRRKRSAKAGSPFLIPLFPPHQ